MHAALVLAALATTACGRFGFDRETRDVGVGDAFGDMRPDPDVATVAVVPITGAGTWTAAGTLRRTLATTNPSPGVFTVATWYRSDNFGAMPFSSGIAADRQTFLWASELTARPVFEHQEADAFYASTPTYAMWPHVGVWVHLVVAVELAAPVESERVRWWVNGVPQPTDTGGGLGFPQDLDVYFGDPVMHAIGNKFDGAFDWTGQLAQTYIIFGHALEATAFVADVGGGALRSIAYAGPITPESVYFAYDPAQPAGTNGFAGNPDWGATAMTIANTGLPY